MALFGLSSGNILNTPKTSLPPLTSPPLAPSQPSKQNSPLAINLEPLELIFSTPPTSPHLVFNSLEYLPPRTTNPPPLQPSLDSIKRLANQPPPIPEVMEPSFPPFPHHLLSQSQPMWSTNDFPLLTHKMFYEHDENPIRTLGDYSRLSHEGYRNTIEYPEGNNVVPLRSDTIWLVQNVCSFHKLRSEDPNQHLKDFLKLLAIGLNVFQQDPSPRGRILLLVSFLNSFHQEGLQNSAMTSLCSNNINESLFLKHGLVSRTYSNKSLIMASTFGSKSKSFMTMSIPSQDEPSINQPVVSFMTEMPKNPGHY
ncbi:hypothetical protein Tco_0524159 [Tanacetum coccineum]